MRDRGAADALGLVLLAPAAIGLALLVVSLGRRSESNAIVRTAAESAAEAAAVERDPGSARAAAVRVANAMLTDPNVCSNPNVVIDDADFRAGGVVRVTVQCAVSRDGVEVVLDERVSDDNLRYEATAVAHIDEFRATVGTP